MKIESTRIVWIDNCKAFGIALVFYGHLWFASSFPSVEVELQNKLIYSFHMPMFFILSGVFAKTPEQKFEDFIKKQIFTRLVPVLIFNILTLFCQVSVDLYSGQLHIKSYLLGMVSLIRGQPSLNTVTWFLVCLFTTEIIHFYISKIAKNKGKKLLLASLFYCLGFVVTWKIEEVSQITGIAKNFWFIHEALTAYSFFLLGSFLHQSKAFEFAEKSLKKYVYFLVSTVFLLLTFNLNQGFHDPSFTIPSMISSIHGDPVWFLVTALAGSVSLISFSHIIPTNRVFLFLGKNTLILMGLNGIFRDFINPMVVRLIPNQALTSHPTLLLVCLPIILISLVACSPVVIFLNKLFPQVVGRPQCGGPILPKLI